MDATRLGMGILLPEDDPMSTALGNLAKGYVAMLDDREALAGHIIEIRDLVRGVKAVAWDKLDACENDDLYEAISRCNALVAGLSVERS
jgi:hypothetical protein